ncbi:MAG: M14 family metallopeptidase [Planctomycetota bacterium]
MSLGRRALLMACHLAGLHATLLLAACQGVSSPLEMPRTLPPAPKTVPESSGDTATCSHAQLQDFLAAVQAAGDGRVVRRSFGTTTQGRDMPLLVVANPPVADAAAAWASGKPRVLVMANIHAGEVEGKEACLELLRQIVWGEEAAAGATARHGDDPYSVGDVVLLVVPNYNPDGNDAFGPKHRPLQNGPRLTGQRPNAAGLDLNRDFLKHEAVESRALATLLVDFDPHIVVDLHTTNGSAHGYELTYAGPLTPAAHPELSAAAEQRWLPELRRRMRERHGFETYDYGNFMTPAEDFQDTPDLVTGWRSFDHRPRFGNNTLGLRNRLPILSEAYAYADFRTRINVTRAFVTEILRLAAERGPELAALCQRLDDETARLGAQGQLLQPTAAELVSRGVEPLLLRGFRELVDRETGVTTRIADGPRRTIDVPAFVRFQATTQRLAPRAYLLPPGRPDLIERLRRHGLRLETLTESVTRRVEVHRVADVQRAAESFQGHRTLSVRWLASEEDRVLPPGSVRVPLDQPLARLAFQLLDPQAEDGLVVWNAFDLELDAGPGAELPVYGER